MDKNISMCKKRDYNEFQQLKGIFTHRGSQRMIGGSSERKKKSERKEGIEDVRRKHMRGRV
jgi:hypothetical protein